MTDDELKQMLESLISTWENEVIEFKNYSRDPKSSEIGSYFSALANEANLFGKKSAWFVLGVDDKSRAVTGTNCYSSKERILTLKNTIFQNTSPHTTFRNIYEIDHTDGRVILFEVPSSPVGQPIAYNGFLYGRAGESLVALGTEKTDRIRYQQAIDWSAQIIPNATVDHLDEEALRRAREAFARKPANRFSVDVVMGWSFIDFLQHSRLATEEGITRAALLLLGKPESTYLLSPHPAEITWKLEAENRAYEHFSPPFFVATTRLYQKIRNYKIRVQPENSLFQEEVIKYDEKIVLEALHNCIAHQDYTQNGRIIVTERPNKLEFENHGSFFFGNPYDYLANHRTPAKYRNLFLAQAMYELNMIDRMGYGIQDMLIRQKERYLPLPDFDLSEYDKVRVVIHGAIIDEAYSKLLLQKVDLPIQDIIALDRVQKRLNIDDEMARHLRKCKMIEGRKPNYHISAKIASVTSKKAEYIHYRGQDDDHYMHLISVYLKKFKFASRRDIDKLLLPKLSDYLNEEQKINKVSNLLTRMRRNGIITNSGPKCQPRWVFAERKKTKM